MGILGPLWIPPITVTNVHDRAVIESGFLVGTALPTVSSVRVRVDNGVFEDAVLTGTTWRYRLPSGSAGLRQGNAHSITVCGTACLPSVGEVRLSVTKGINKDINGDGYPDVVVGSYGRTNDRGEAFIYYSTGVGGVANASGTAGAHSILTGQGSFGEFARSVAMGDVNGDGFADIIVGGSGIGGGRVFVFHSTGSAGIPTLGVASANTVLQTAVAIAFGYEVASGDLNGDGYDDVIVQGDQFNSDQGRVYIYYSTGASGVPSGTDGSANATLTGENTNDRFGYAMVTGDVNRDGFADLVVGALGYNGGSNRGRVYVFHSSSTGIATAGAASANTILTGEPGATRFGGSLAIGDVTKDGFEDVIVGADTYSGGAANRGRAYVFHSNGPSGLIASAGAASAHSILTGENAGDRFGTSVGTGDFNGDGAHDLIVGAARYGGNLGRAYAFLSAGDAGLPVSVGASAADSSFTNPTAGYFLGTSVSTRDVNGDGFADVLVGAERLGSVGRAYVFLSRGAAALPATIDVASADTTLIGQSPNDYFGSSLAWLTQGPQTDLAYRLLSPAQHRLAAFSSFCM